MGALFSQEEQDNRQRNQGYQYGVSTGLQAVRWGAWCSLALPADPRVSCFIQLHARIFASSQHTNQQLWLYR
jgi:hypothetical protein